MTTNHQPPTKPRRVSLRALALELGVHHASLSAAARDGRLTDGVRLDARGRTTVIDADAAGANWRAVHVPQTREAERRKAQAQRERAAQAESRCAQCDEHDADLTHDLVIGALVRNALAGSTDHVAAGSELVERVLPHLLEEAEWWRAKAEYLDSALAMIEATVDHFITELDNETDEDNEPETP